MEKVSRDNFDKRLKEKMRNGLILHFEKVGYSIDFMLTHIDFLLTHIISLLNILYEIRESTILYKRNIEELLFRQLLKNNRNKISLTKKERKKVIRLRYSLFSFLVTHQYLVESPNNHEKHTRIAYELGPRYMDIRLDMRFNLLPDMEKIRESVSPKFYEFLVQEGISSYLEFLELHYLQEFTVEELEERIDELSEQKNVLTKGAQLITSTLSSHKLEHEFQDNIQTKKLPAINYFYAIKESKKLYNIVLKIKANPYFVSELTKDKIPNKLEKITMS